MAANWTESEINKAQRALGTCIIPPLILGCLTGLAILSTFFSRMRKNPEYDPPIYIIAILPICLVLGWALGQCVVYFGLPKRLTFGVQVGKIFPASCEASRQAEGPRGLPCCLKNMREWTASFFVVVEDASYSLEDVKACWILKSVWVFLILALILTPLLYLILPKHTDKRDQAEKCYEKAEA